jgi:hypothetical protein
VERKQEKLFELEVLLKGLVRYSNLNNHPMADRANLLNRDFGAEIEVVRNALVRSVILIRSLLPEAESNVLHFRNYVEARLLSDYQRAQFLSRAINQTSPIESLYILCYSLIDFSELCNNLLLLDEKRYQVFYYLEQMIAREITANRYFNPFRALGFMPHYDVVRSQRITKVINSIDNKELNFGRGAAPLQALALPQPDQRRSQGIAQAQGLVAHFCAHQFREQGRDRCL